MGSKWFSKLGIALAGIAMAVGVGVCLGQKEFKKAEAAEQTATLSQSSGTANYKDSKGNTWSASKTADNEISVDASTWLKVGTNSVAATSISLESSAYNSYSIKSITVHVKAKANTNAYGYIYIGGEEVKKSSLLTNTDTSVSFDNTSAKKSGTIVVACTRDSSANGALYLGTVVVTYDDGSSSPAITLSSANIAIGRNLTGTFTIDAANLTDQLVVTSGNTNYVTVNSVVNGSGVAPANPTADGAYTVTLGGVAVTASDVTVTVTSTKDNITKTISVAVEIRPMINTNLSSMTWGTSAYADAPHILTYNSNYQFIVSAGQLYSSTAYLGSNGKNYKDKTSSADWSLSESPINTAIVNDNDASWSTYGSSFYMSNFGIVHPTSFSVNAGTVAVTSASWYILASSNAGDSWTVVESGNSIAAGTAMTWSGDTYSSNANPILFAFVMTHGNAKTISNITVQAYGDSLSVVTKGAVRTFTIKYLHMHDYDAALNTGVAGAGYCADNEHGYYLAAKTAFNALSSDAKDCFKHTGDYASEADTFESARARYQAWAIANDDGAPYDGNNDVQTHLRTTSFMSAEELPLEKNTVLIAIIIAAGVSALAVGGYFFIRRKHQ